MLAKLIKQSQCVIIHCTVSFTAVLIRLKLVLFSTSQVTAAHSQPYKVIVNEPISV